MALTVCAPGCTYADTKGRETLRLGPLRDLRPSAKSVDSVVTVDAGTDALTDSELLAVERALAPALLASLQKLGGVPVGLARVGACKLRAGPSERFVLYVAKCHVSLVVDGVSAVEVQTEALRRTQNVFERSPKARAPGDERDPAVDARECQAVLIDALDAAARMIVDGALPLTEGEEAPLPRPQRMALARERLARAIASPAASSSDKVAALYDLRSAGMPADAALVVPVLDAAVGNDDTVIIVAALDAIGELCDPSLRGRVEAVFVDTGSELLHPAKERTLARLRACAALPQ